MSLLSYIKPGNKAIITKIIDEQLSLQLLDFGCYIGQTIEISYKAPLGCPIAIKILDSIISLRIADAEKIEVELIN
ncbi:MAG: ferrous iron transport protein A [Bacteroidetes bacterium]|nr:ferrous iron transport protein A [Bacteroidota bacterium]